MHLDKLHFATYEIYEDGKQEQSLSGIAKALRDFLLKEVKEMAI